MKQVSNRNRFKNPDSRTNNQRRNSRTISTFNTTSKSTAIFPLFPKAPPYFKRSTTSMNSNESSSKWTAILATAAAGVITGCMTFVSAVDTRSFVRHVDKTKGNTEIARAHFQVWWPYGRDLMVPLIGTASLLHAAVCYATGGRNWGISGVCLFSIGPYTRVMLGEDIEKLRSSSTDEVAETTIQFCRRHHVRLVLAAVGFGLSLVGLAEM